MLESISLSNYRGIRKKKEFLLKPITILIGPNNSGKSSLIKSVLLLKENSSDIEILQILNGDHKLGNFSSLLSEGSHKKTVEFEIPLFIPSIGYAKIKLQYKGKSNNINNGLISRLEISKQYYSGKKKNILSIEEIEYWPVSNYIQSLNFKINYFTYYGFLKLETETSIEQQIKKNAKEENSFIKPLHHKFLELEKLKEFSTLKYDSGSPLFNFNIKNENLDRSNFDKKNQNQKLDIKFLKFYSTLRQCRLNPEEDYTVLDALFSALRNDFSAPSNLFPNERAELIKFKELHNITKIEPTVNGVLFFDKVRNDINETLKIYKTQFNNISYLSSSSTEQERLFTDGGNNYFQSILTRYLESPNYERGRKFIDDWMKTLGLIEQNQSIVINRIAQSAFEIIIKEKNSNKNKNLADCGYGVTQILTLLIEFAIGKRNQYIIEEPEANLHPALQSKLADLFASLKYSKFIIETHSEYMVRKFQYLVAKGELKKEDIIIHYFWKDKKGNHCKSIELKDNGGLTDTFEKGFYDESNLIQLETYLLNSHN